MNSKKTRLYKEVTFQMLGARYAGEDKKEDALLDRLDDIWFKLNRKELREVNRWSKILSTILP
jgi:hypothetical protein